MNFSNISLCFPFRYLIWLISLIYWFTLCLNGRYFTEETVFIIASIKEPGGLSALDWITIPQCCGWNCGGVCISCSNWINDNFSLMGIFKLLSCSFLKNCMLRRFLILNKKKAYEFSLHTPLKVKYLVLLKYKSLLYRNLSILYLCFLFSKNRFWKVKKPR